MPFSHVFIHGKAGVIETAHGGKTCFLGSVNESRSAFAQNYEILWEDTSPEGVAWVEAEFEVLDRRYGMAVLDEAHKARRRGGHGQLRLREGNGGKDAGKANVRGGRAAASD